MPRPIGIKIRRDFCRGRVIAGRLLKKITIPVRRGVAKAALTLDFA